MSAYGTERTWQMRRRMFAFGGKADIKGPVCETSRQNALAALAQRANHSPRRLSLRTPLPHRCRLRYPTRRTCRATDLRYQRHRPRNRRRLYRHSRQPRPPRQYLLAKLNSENMPRLPLQPFGKRPNLLRSFYSHERVYTAWYLQINQSKNCKKL